MNWVFVLTLNIGLKKSISPSYNWRERERERDGETREQSACTHHLHASHPLGNGEVNLAREIMHVPDQRWHDIFESRVGIPASGSDDAVCEAWIVLGLASPVANQEAAWNLTGFGP